MKKLYEITDDKFLQAIRRGNCMAFLSAGKNKKREEIINTFKEQNL